MAIELIEINPIDKVQEFVDKLKGHNVSVKKKSDAGYEEFLENDDDVCVVVTNPNSDEPLYIRFENQGEIILFYDCLHSHYFNYEYMYENLCEDTIKILNSELGAATLFCNTDDEKSWLGSTFVTKDNAEQSIDTVFEFVLKHKEHKNKLKGFGGRARFLFWDKSLCKTVEIEKASE